MQDKLAIKGALATMNNAVAFDTYTYVKKLRDAGMNEQQAAIQAEALVNLIEERLATKADLARVEAELKTNLASVEAKLEVKIIESKAETIRWMISLSLAQLGFITGILITIFKLMSPSH